MSIGTHPAPSISLEQDLRLLKAGLLYADRITLYSPTASMIYQAVNLGDVSNHHKLNLLRLTIPYLQEEDEAKKTLENLELLDKILRKKQLKKEDLILKAKFLNFIDKHWTEIKDISQEIGQKAGIGQLDLAINSGFVELYNFNALNKDNEKITIEFMADCIASAKKSKMTELHAAKIESKRDSFTAEFIEQLVGAVVNGSTFPLFDDQTGNLIKNVVNKLKGSASDDNFRRGKHSGLVAFLLKQLPLFEQARIDEILDIRKELDKYLLRFRKEIFEYSEMVRSAQWDRNFASEASDIFNRNVAPTIQDIEEEIRSNNSLRLFAKKIVEKPFVLPSGGALDLVLSRLSYLPEGFVEGLGLGGALAAVIYHTYNEWLKKNEITQQSNLFFYYKANKMLS